MPRPPCRMSAPCRHTDDRRPRRPEGHRRRRFRIDCRRLRSLSRTGRSFRHSPGRSLPRPRPPYRCRFHPSPPDLSASREVSWSRRWSICQIDGLEPAASETGDARGRPRDRVGELACPRRDRRAVVSPSIAAADGFPSCPIRRLKSSMPAPATRLSSPSPPSKSASQSPPMKVSSPRLPSTLMT